jgi:SAM-dependent methyltransferase
LEIDQKKPTERVFDQMGDFWAQIADYSSTEKQLDFVREYLIAGGLVLDLGCGSARHSIPLFEAGCAMVCIDISKRLLLIARAKAADKNISLPLVNADMRFLPFRSEAFSSVISLDTSFGYLQTEDEDRNALKEVRRGLKTSGRFVLDLFNRELLLKRYGKIRNFDICFFLARLLGQMDFFSNFFRWREYPTFFLLQKRRLSYKGAMLQDNWILREKKTSKFFMFEHSVRLYSYAKIKALLLSSCLHVTKVRGDYGNGAYYQNSKRLIVIAEKDR